MMIMNYDPSWKFNFSLQNNTYGFQYAIVAWMHKRRGKRVWKHEWTCISLVFVYYQSVI